MGWAALTAVVAMVLPAMPAAAADGVLHPTAASVSSSVINGGQPVLLPGTTGNSVVLTGTGFSGDTQFQLTGSQTNGMTITNVAFNSATQMTLTVDVAAFAVGPYVLRTKQPAEAQFTPVTLLQAYVGTGTLFPLGTPTRVADNRSGIGGRSTVLPPGQTWRIKVAGEWGIPSTATAVSLNLTAIGGANGGWLALYPAGGTVPPVSSVNFGPGGEIVPNHAIVPIGVDGSLDLYNGSGDDVFALVDVDGYFSGENVPGGLMYSTQPPWRSYDGREAGLVMQPGQTISVSVKTSTGFVLPAGRVADVNVTFTNQTEPGWASVFSGSAASTTTSTHNWIKPYQDTANRAAVVVGDGGIHITNSSAGTVQVIVDLFGVYSPTVGYRFAPLPPNRFLDTRSALPSGQSGSLTVDTTTWVVPRPYFLVGNLTGTGATSSTYFQLWSTLASPAVPTVSSLNLQAGETRANSFIIGLPGDNTIRINNAFGNTHAIVDIVGVFSP